MASQQKSHVPKFGNWDSDNIPYTAYFERARRDKSKGNDKVFMNPNDPEENPEAFMAMEMTLNHKNKSSSQLPSLPHFKSTTSSSNYKSKYSSNEQSSNYYNTQVENRRRRIKISNGSQKSINDQSKANTSTERSSSDYSNSLQQQSRRSPRFDSNNKSTTYSSDDLSAALLMQGHIRRSSGSRSHSIDHQQRAASIPKFGAWDETDPRSGENFTIIFNKVKEEKQNIASAQFPIPFNPPHVRNQRSRSSASKICCCLFSNGGD